MNKILQSTCLIFFTSLACGNNTRSTPAHGTELAQFDPLSPLTAEANVKRLKKPKKESPFDPNSTWTPVFSEGDSDEQDTPNIELIELKEKTMLEMMRTFAVEGGSIFEQDLKFLTIQLEAQSVPNSLWNGKERVWGEEDGPRDGNVRISFFRLSW